MKKFCIVLICILALGIFAGCGASNENSETPVTKATEAPSATEKNDVISTQEPEEPATPAPTEEPKSQFSEVDEIPEFVPEVDKYYDVWADLQYHIIPGNKTEIELPGDINTWKIAKNSILTYSVENGRLFVTAKDTGFVNLISEDGKRAAIYSNKAPEKNERRAVDPDYKYYLYFEKGTHTLTIYTADETGYYTVPFRTICSASGATMDKTPTGMFELGTKERWHVFSKNCLAQYGINYAKGVFLHSPCYEYERESSILSHYYNTIGDSSTGGCLRMQTGYIAWIFENCKSGTKLEITNGNPLGTACGKPAAIQEAACFDPTDPYIKNR